MSLSYVVKKETKRCFDEGMKADLFTREKIETLLGGKCYQSTITEDTKKHVDFWWDAPNGKRYGIDVKDSRKNKRTDSDKDYSITWLEIQNVSGKPGWIYGEEDYIVFKTDNKLLFIKREQLAYFAETKYNEYISSGKNIVYDTPQECYVPYQRAKWGRKDIAFKAYMKDLEDISHFYVNYITDEVVTFNNKSIAK